MKIKNIISVLEEMAPLAYAEDFDNVGLLVGNSETECSGVLVCHDALESVIDEAVAKNCNLVVCFHPILFSGIKKITGKNYVERAILKAIKNDIAIYAVHTALDNHSQGVNKIFCDALGLTNTKVLIPKQNFIQKLVTFTVPDNADKVRNAMFEAGAGTIGNYDNCSFYQLLLQLHFLKHRGKLKLLCFRFPNCQLKVLHCQNLQHKPKEPFLREQILYF